MKPPARAILGNLVWSTDGGVWAVWRVAPFPHAHTSMADKLAVHGRLRGMLLALPTESMLLSVCERLDPLDVVGGMIENVDIETLSTWRITCEATAEWLDQVPLYRRRYYVTAKLPDATSWRDTLRDVTGSFAAAFGLAARSLPRNELDTRARQASGIERQLQQHVPVERVTAGEVCWIYARGLRRATGSEPTFDARWEPRSDGPIGEPTEARSRIRPRGILAHLTDVVVTDGGDASDEDRPHHRRYVRLENGAERAYQTVLALADMPHYFEFPGGGGEWLFHLDQVGFPVDWCVRAKAIPNVEAQSKVRRKHRDLIGQIDEYDGEVTGAPPQLAEAIRSIDTERNELGSNPAEAEFQTSILLSIAASSLVELEEQADAITALFQPQEYGLARPTGGQLGLLRSMFPGTAAAPVCRDYTQFMLARDLAAGSPFCGSDVGDPAGLLLGASLDSGMETPVLFDPAFGPRVNASPSLAAVGRLGSGKSYFLKRLCWDTIARGGQVVTIDRTPAGEYVRFADAVPDRVQIVRVESGADVCLDPLRSFTGDVRETVTLGFLSILTGVSAQGEEGSALAEAVDTVCDRPGSRLDDVVTELSRMGERPDPAAKAVARRLAHYRRSATGKLVFGNGRPLQLDADFIVFWMPNLALPDKETLQSEHRSRTMLPEQVLGQALLYLVAAVGRQVVFRDPGRFAAALYDEAWALLASPHGEALLIEGVRDGRKHNGAIWLASQHPNDFGVSELHDLLGPRFVFRQARTAIPAALRLLGVDGSADAKDALERGLENGQCLYRDVRERVGLIQVLPPALAHIEAAFDTTPGASGRVHEGREILGAHGGANDEPLIATVGERLEVAPGLGVSPGPGPGPDPAGRPPFEPLSIPAAASLTAAPPPPVPAPIPSPGSAPPAAAQMSPAPPVTPTPAASATLDDQVAVAEVAEVSEAPDVAEVRKKVKTRRRTPLSWALQDQGEPE